MSYADALHRQCLETPGYLEQRNRSRYAGSKLMSGLEYYAPTLVILTSGILRLSADSYISGAPAKPFAIMPQIWWIALIDSPRKSYFRRSSNADGLLHDKSERRHRIPRIV